MRLAAFKSAYQSAELERSACHKLHTYERGKSGRYVSGTRACPPGLTLAGANAVKALPFWDDELETLSSEVIALFGAQALDEAVVRATNRCYQDRGAPTSADPLAKFSVAVKEECRRLLVPH